MNRIQQIKHRHDISVSSWLHFSSSKCSEQIVKKAIGWRWAKVNLWQSSAIYLFRNLVLFRLQIFIKELKLTPRTDLSGCGSIKLLFSDISIRTDGQIRALSDNFILIQIRKLSLRGGFLSFQFLCSAPLKIKRQTSYPCHMEVSPPFPPLPSPPHTVSFTSIGGGGTPSNGLA